MSSGSTSESSSFSLEGDQFIKGDVEEQKTLEVAVKKEEKAAPSLDDFITLRWYCMLVLLMAELTAFTATASSKVMVFAGILFQTFDPFFTTVKLLFVFSYSCYVIRSQTLYRDQA